MIVPAETVFLDDLDPALADILKASHYYVVRILPTGEIAGVLSYLYTFGITTGLDVYGYRTRWCYEKPIEAVMALMSWDGKGHPPGNWIVQKPEDIRGPGSQQEKGLR